MTFRKKLMTLRKKQSTFARMAAQLILTAEELGYEVTFGEAYRDPEWAEMMFARGKGIKDSLHSVRLAIDLNLFKDGVYLEATEDHRILGEWWESVGGSWGGRFGDGNHYSLEHEGRR